MKRFFTFAVLLYLTAHWYSPFIDTAHAAVEYVQEYVTTPAHVAVDKAEEFLDVLSGHPDSKNAAKQVKPNAAQRKAAQTKQK